MTIDLNELASRIAGELARADQARSGGAKGGGNGAGGPPRFESATGLANPQHQSSASLITATQPPAGVTWVRDGARIADFIDHTLLKAEATRSDVETLCAEAREHHFAAVCVNPVWVPLCAKLLAGSGVKLATVVGFPLGATMPEIKAAEANLAVQQGADEIDMVAAIGQIKSGDWAHCERDIAAVVRASQGRVVKVIIESAILTPVEIIKISALAKEAGAHYVKTSTGFHSGGGASAEAVALMRLAVGDALGVKASGGVRDCAAAMKMIASGATRIGTSGGVAMAKCLGPGPAPIRELLASPHVHTSACTSGACAHQTSASSAGQPY
jgi:deoxyribose-phosphate aldolase